MTHPRLPKDADFSAIPVLGIGKVHKFAISTSAAAKNTDAFPQSKETIVTVLADDDCYIKFGDNTVEATTDDHLVKGGIPFDVNTKGNEYISVLATVAGDVRITERT